LATIFQNQVRLKSGGSIVITPTEALVSIDVNSGKGTKEDNLEDTAFATNLEAAEEVARQLRLRDLGGLVVVDFIDMREERHRRDVERRIREATKVDKAKTDFGMISKFGLLELTRQRMRPSIETGSHVTCPHCQGRGLVKTPENASLGFLRQAAHTLSKGGLGGIKARLNPDVAHYLLNYKRLDLSRLEERYEARVLITGDPALAPGLFELESFKKSAETEMIKPGQVAGLFDDDVHPEGLDYDQADHRHDSFRDNSYNGSRASSQSHSSSQSPGGETAPGPNHGGSSSRSDPKGGRSRGSRRRGPRADYAKNGDSEAALAF
jgi:hypothetical protein